MSDQATPRLAHENAIAAKTQLLDPRLDRRHVMLEGWSYTADVVGRKSATYINDLQGGPGRLHRLGDNPQRLEIAPRHQALRTHVKGEPNLAPLGPGLLQQARRLLWLGAKFGRKMEEGSFHGRRLQTNDDAYALAATGLVDNLRQFLFVID